jgi:methyl-accepting chemotaxis protein
VPTRILALLLLLLALVAAGCGGDDEPSSSGGGGTTQEEAEPAGDALSDEDYITELNEAQTTFVDAVSGLNLANPDSPNAFADAIEELSGNVDTLVGDLEQVNPPEEIADLHQQLIDGMTEYSATISENVEGLRGEQSELLKAAQAISTASTEFSTEFGDLVAQINEKLGATGG